jgi:hypothetical protein
MKHVPSHLFVLDITLMLTLTLALNLFIQPKHRHLIQQQTKNYTSFVPQGVFIENIM